MLLALALATLLSEDLACAAAGALVARGELGFWPATLACFAGILAGDVLLFLAGRALGSVALERAPLRWFLSPERVERAAGWLERRGAVVVLLTRFLPGTRLPTYFASGALGTDPLRFTLWFSLAGLVWTPLLVGLSAGIGASFERRLAFLERHGWLLALATAAVLVLALALVRGLATARGRGLLRSRFRRLTRFEYWPSWALYAPVVLYCVWLALRHRSLRAFTAANPALPCGGLAGESKGAILRALEPSGRVPPTTTLPAHLTLAERRARLGAFMEQHALALPIVLKPDVGERGKGVVVAHTPDEVERALSGARGALLAQAYVPGLEFGILHVRRPGETHGRITSLARKHLPVVTGDGSATLEQLVLADDRHVAMARFFLAQHAGALERVPAAGELVLLGHLGTHCRGATFLDAAHLDSEDLVREVARVSRTFAGFHLGRYDVRAESEEALRAGRFTVLELNGVASEPAHVYDPRHSVWRAWRDLCRQWALAFEIGSTNLRAGARVAAWRELALVLR